MGRFGAFIGLSYGCGNDRVVFESPNYDYSAVIPPPPKGEYDYGTTGQDSERSDEGGVQPEHTVLAEAPPGEAGSPCHLAPNGQDGHMALGGMVRPATASQAANYESGHAVFNDDTTGTQYAIAAEPGSTYAIAAEPGSTYETPIPHNPDYEPAQSDYAQIEDYDEAQGLQLGDGGVGLRGTQIPMDNDDYVACSLPTLSTYETPVSQNPDYEPAQRVYAQVEDYDDYAGLDGRQVTHGTAAARSAPREGERTTSASLA